MIPEVCRKSPSLLGQVVQTQAAAVVRPEVRQVPWKRECLPTEGKLTEECMEFWTDALRA